MRVILLILLLTPFILLRADALQSESDANMFVIGLAAQRALEIQGFKFDGSIKDSSISIQSNFIALTRDQTVKYTDGKPSAVVRGGVVVTIQKPSDGSTPFRLEFIAEQQTASDSWSKINSKGVLERELVDEIIKLIDRYRKSPSLN